MGGMKSINIEGLMNHSTGVSDSYFLSTFIFLRVLQGAGKDAVAKKLFLNRRRNLSFNGLNTKERH
jgi:hypothetical protein